MSIGCVRGLFSLFFISSLSISPFSNWFVRVSLSLCVSSLVGKDFVGSDGGSTYKYYLSLCGTLSSPAASTCNQISSTSSACQIQQQGGVQTFDIGNYDVNSPPTWSYVDEEQTAVQYNITGAVQWSAHIIVYHSQKMSPRVRSSPLFSPGQN